MLCTIVYNNLSLEVRRKLRLVILQLVAQLLSYFWLLSMSLRLQQSSIPGVDFASLSTEQLHSMAKQNGLELFYPAIQSELANRNKPKATLTVELLRNSNVKSVGDSGMSRVQGNVVSGKFQNPGDKDEMTFGFGKNFSVAQIGIFLLIPDEQLERLNFSTSSHVTVEVSLTVNPNGGHFILAAGEIPELRSVFVPQNNRNQSLQVWIGPNGEEHCGKQGPEGYTLSKLPSYGNVTVLDILEVNTVNLALTNSIVPHDPSVWLLEASKAVAKSRSLNLNAYQQKRSAERDAEGQTPANSNIAAMAATLETSEIEVKI